MSKQVVHATTGAVTSSEHGVEPEDLHIWVAATNRSNQMRMLRSVAQAHADAGGNVQAAAEALDVEVSVVQDALEGKTDLTLTEMRFLFSACDVVVDYSVRPARAARAMSTIWRDVVSHVIDSKSHSASRWADDPVLLLHQQGSTWAKGPR